MSRYNKIESRMWGDAKFCSLSPMQPSGQALWIYLLTGPHTLAVPGIYRAGRAAMAEELGWDEKAFGKAFQECFDKGMVKADWKARVIYIPKAILHNKPQNPNVVKFWATEFDSIPECPLKAEAYESLKAAIHALGKAFGNAFDNAFTKPSVNDMPNDMPIHKHEHEHEHEHEQTTCAANEKSLAPVRIEINPEWRWENITDQDRERWREAYPAIDLDSELAKAASWLKANPKNRKSNYAKFLTNWFSKAQDRAPRQHEHSIRTQPFDAWSHNLSKLRGH